jgi:hypothetical protein
VDGPHPFTSLLVTNGGVLTHSPPPNGEADNRLNLTIAGDVMVDATSAINANGRGYGSGSGPSKSARLTLFGNWDGSLGRCHARYALSIPARFTRS